MSEPDPSEPSKTEPHLRITKAAHDAILGHPDARARAPLLAIYLALARAENDTRSGVGGYCRPGDSFGIGSSELGRLAGLSPRAVEKHLPTLATLGLLAVMSGRATRTQNSYRRLAAQGPPTCRPTSRPSSLAEVEKFALDQGLEIRTDTAKVFWDSNEAREWQILTKCRQRSNPCRDWQTLFLRFVEKHRPALSSAEGARVTPARPASRAGRSREAASTLIADMPEPIAKRMRDLCDLVRPRSYDTPWSSQEMAAFRAAGLESIRPRDFADAYSEVANHYEAMLLATCNGAEGKDSRRRNLLSLLRHWNPVVENARAYRSRGAIPDRADDGPQAWTYANPPIPGVDPFNVNGNIPYPLAQ